MLSDFLIFAHPAFGVLAILATTWLLVEAMNANATNGFRLRKAAWSVAFFMVLALLFGGQWYVVYYPIEKAVILKGPWPFAHNFFMEVKEHLFFIPLILSLYLPIIVSRNKLETNLGARKIVITICSIIIGLSLFIEGAGAIINEGAKISYKQTNMQGEQK
ncbi:MAG: hypothetical protein PHX13_06715 [Thiovulaceae bacterium]|nr:hypothetical protein [Sulfurimonadaceae bacterium]